MDLELIQAIFEGETRDSVLRVRDGVVNALRLLERDFQDIRFRRQLTGEYWKLVRFILLRRIPADGETDIRFSRAERLVLDHGFLSPDLTGEAGVRSGDLEAMQLQGTIPCAYPITAHSLSSFFVEQYRFFLECRGHDRLRRKLDELRETHARERMALLLSRAEREQWLEGMVQDRERLQALKEINRRLEEIQTELVPRRLAIGRGYSLTDEQRQAILSLENQSAALQKERRALYGWLHLAGGSLGARLSTLDRGIEDASQRVLELATEERRCGQEFQEIVRETTTISPEKKSAFLDEWLKAIQSMSRLMVKRDHGEAEPFLSGEYPFDLFEQALDYLQLAQSQDLDLFNNCQARFARPPHLVFLPLTGHGFYDPRGNLLFVPLRNREGPLSSLLTALGQYRWAHDDTGRIRTLYRGLPGHAVLAPSQLEERFSRQYRDFLAGGRDGEPLPPPVEAWFRDFLCRPSGREEGFAPAPRPVTPPPDLFARRVAVLIEQIGRLAEIADLDEHLVIRRSLEREGCIDILLCNLPAASEKLIRLIEALAMQGKLNRFRDLDL